MTPRTDPVTRLLLDLQSRLLADRSGEIATYIPELSTANPDHLGIAVTSVDGHTYLAGDADVPATIQSVSKPFVYALALEDHGLDAVLRQVGSEPSGEAFNAISLEAQTGRPANPMINAGAIVATSLVQAPDPAARFERIRGTLSAYAGRDLAVDEAVYESEQETGDTNRALAYLMKSAGSLNADVDETLETYFRQCAVLVTARDLSVMAATLANGGLNPVTGIQMTSPDVTTRVLAVMATCGMYDFSGEWMLRVGLPAKSGVSGTLLALKPGQFGIGLYSPPLDPRGNSVRGVAACTELAERFDLHLLAPVDRAISPIRLRKRIDNACHLEIQGDISFISAERIVHELRDLEPGLDEIVLDLDSVSHITESARQLLVTSIQDLRAAAVRVSTTPPLETLICR